MVGVGGGVIKKEMCPNNWVVVGEGCGPSCVEERSRDFSVKVTGQKGSSYEKVGRCTKKKDVTHQQFSTRCCSASVSDGAEG